MNALRRVRTCSRLPMIPYVVEMEVVDKDEEDAARCVGGWPRRRQDDALLDRRRWRRGEIRGAPAVHEDERDDILLDAVFEDRELVLRQVGHELPLLITDDDVGGDDVD